MRKIIRNWEELADIPKESATHILEICLDGGYAWINTKNRKPYNNKLSFMEQIKNQNVYLSTHTFYNKRNAENTSKKLRACGFDVKLDNWDTGD